MSINFVAIQSEVDYNLLFKVTLVIYNNYLLSGIINSLWSFNSKKQPGI